jgi:hypothetical protein
MGFVYSEPAARFLGVPTYMWREFARTQLRYTLSRFFAWPGAFDIASEYQFLRGAIHEQRLMAREEHQREEGRTAA